MSMQMSRRSSKASSFDHEDLREECMGTYITIFGDLKTDIRSKTDLLEALEWTGRNLSQKALRKYWSSDTRSLGFDDFVDICRKEHPTSSEDLMKAFKKIDINGDGFITRDELHKIMTQNGEEMTKREVQDLIDEVDDNGDGKLCYEEYCNMVNKTMRECKQVSRKMLEKKEKRKRPDLSDSRRGEAGSQLGSQLSVRSNSSQRRKTEKDNIDHDDDDDIQTSHREIAGSSMSLRKSRSSDMGSKISVKSNRPTSANKSGANNRTDRCEVTGAQTSDGEDTGSALSLTEQSTDFGSKVSVRSARSKHSETNRGDRKTGGDVDLHTSSGEATGSTLSLKKQSKTLGSNLSLKSTSSRTVEQSASHTRRSTKHELSGDEDDIIEEEDIPQTSRSTSRSIRGSQGSVFSFMKSTEDDSNLSQKATEDEAKRGRKSSVKSGDLIGGSRASLKSADRPMSGSRRSLLSIGEKIDLLNAPVPAQRKSLSRSLFPEDDFPKPSPRSRKEGVYSNGAANKLGPLADPKNIKEWTHASSKGAFFIDEESIVCHQYNLVLTEETQVWITIRPLVTKSMIIGDGDPIDTALLIYNDKTDRLELTEKRDGKGKYGIKCTLKPGKYRLIPFTTGCRLKPRRGAQTKETPLIKKDRDGKIAITKAFRKALEDIFDMCDLDGNGLMSRDEFSWFNMRTSGEKVSDEEWEVVEDHADLENGELTKPGFVHLNEMEAQDGDGDTEDLWVTLDSMGYNKELFVDETCPFKLDVYTEDCDDADLSVSTIEAVDKALIIKSIMEKGDKTRVKGMKDLEMYVYSNPTRASVVLENSSNSKVKVEVDCSSCKNCTSSKDILTDKVMVLSRSQEIGHHLVPGDESLDWVVRTNEIIHK